MAEDDRTITADEAAEAERTRIQHLEMLGQQHSLPRARIEAWRDQGVSFAAAAREIMADARRTPPRPSSTPTDMLGDLVGSRRDAEAMSVSGVILEAGKETTPGIYTELSRHLEAELPKGYTRHGGEHSLLVPHELFNRRARRGSKYSTRAGLDTQTPTAGAETVFEELIGFGALLRNRAVTLRAGVTYMPGLRGDAVLVKQTGAATAHWVAENPVADVAESELALDLVKLQPKTLQGTTFYSRQLLRQSTPVVDELVETDLTDVHALEVDRAVIHGTGADNQPEGVYEADGVHPVAFGGAPTYAKIVEMETAIADANGDAERMAAITTPGVRSRLRQTRVLSDATDSVVIWTGGPMNGMVNGYPAFATNQVSKTLAGDGSGTTPTPLTHHGYVFGDWSTVHLGEWGVLELIADPFSKKKRGLIEATSFQMVDIRLLNPEKLAKATGLLLS